MTDIIVQDSIAVLEPLFTSHEHPKVIFESAKASILTSGGLIGTINDYLEPTSKSGFDVLMAANQGIVSSQQGVGLFNPSRKREVSEWQFKRFADLDLRDHIRTLLQSLIDPLTFNEWLPQMECLLLPTDPANRGMMVFNNGGGAFGGVAGKIIVQLFPTDGNLARLKPMLARAVIQNVRQAYFQMTGLTTLADWLVMEGLSTAFIAETCPDVDDVWSAVWRKPDDWDDSLAFIANWYGLEHYDDLVTNIYGASVPIGSERPPFPRPLDSEELAYTLDILRANLAETIPHKIAALLFGDELVAPQGYRGEGLSPYAGLFAAACLITDYLNGTQQTVSQVLNTPTQSILDGLLT